MAEQAEGPGGGAAGADGAAEGGAPRTLWVGDLVFWMDESYLHATFSAAGGEVVKTKARGI